MGIMYQQKVNNFKNRGWIQDGECVIRCFKSALPTNYDIFRGSSHNLMVRDMG